MKPSDPLTEHFRLTVDQKKALDKLYIHTVLDLLYHTPARYESAADVRTVADAAPGTEVTLYGMLSKLEIKKSWRTKVPMAEGVFGDGTGQLRVVWFHQPYLAKMLPQGTLVRLSGKVSASKSGGKYIANPAAERAAGIPVFENKEGLYPVYAESAGVTSLWIYHAVQKVLRSGILDTTQDPIAPSILKRYNLPTLPTALVFAHEPKRQSDAEAAKKRFAFEEIFLIQLARARERARVRESHAYTIDADEARVAQFMRDSFDFSPTAGQKRAVGEILADFLEPSPMARLLEGDVGSGKTAVAAAASYAVATSRPQPGKRFGNLQVAYMVPTEILALQHFKTFISFFEKYPLQIGLITGSGCYKFPSKVNPREATPIARSQLLKWVANGEVPILIGTHALIQKSVKFKHLAFVIVDEQHRFGTFQRQAIATKDGRAPHLLSMTATPIPRTLALTIYGDLDLTVLDELPAGRKPIETEIVGPRDRARAYEKVRAKLTEGRQAYVICPRIDEPDPTKAMALQTTSVVAEMKSLTKIFPEYVIDKLHSKMTPKEKDDVMARFAAGTINILVATSVVEVGVNVPNATIIVIEGAERFGLAQLHQLRGRVMRSSHTPYCYLMVDSSAKGESVRLKAIVSAKNGFELAERDLEIRGAGELYGRRQWGISDLGMEALKNLKMVEAARKEAFALIETDPELTKSPLLRELSDQKVKELHFE